MKKLFTIILSAIILAFFLAGCERVPEPRVKEGRFHFSVTYEVKGETQTISGIYVCKFIRATSSINGWWREWKGYIEGSDLEEEFALFTNEDGRMDLDLSLDPFYFMSDPFYDNDPPKPAFSIYYNDRMREETGDLWSYDEELLEERYGVKIISYEYDPPIENVYE